MSYGIVRVQKFTAGSVKGIEIHDLREKEGISHTNKDIDWERTIENYNLHLAQNENYTRAVRERISELPLKKAVRKDAVVMAQVLVTSDHSFFEGLSQDKQEKFFQDSYDFLRTRYGEHNVISATVHLDERTPHMHFNFVPVTEDGRLSAKSVLTRQNLILQQDHFQENVGVKYGLLRGESGGSKHHLEVAEYKAATVQKEISTLQSALIPLKAEYDAYKAFIREYDKQSQISIAIPDYAEIKAKGIFEKTEYITVPREMWEQKHVSANEKSYLEQAQKALDKHITDFKRSAPLKKIAQLEDEVDRLRKLNIKLNKYLDESNEIVKNVNKVFKAFPAVAEQFFVAEQKIKKSFHQKEDFDLER